MCSPESNMWIVRMIITHDAFILLALKKFFQSTVAFFKD